MDTVTTEPTTTGTPVKEEKKVKNILMIGSSFCYYYVEELCGIAKADGYEINVANLYKSGGKAYEHLTSLKTGTPIATFYVTNSKVRREIGKLNTKEVLEYAEKKLKALANDGWKVVAQSESAWPIKKCFGLSNEVDSIINFTLVKE